MNLAGATNATLLLNNVQTNQAGNYSVTLTNAYGATNSSNAALTILADCISASAGLVSWWPAENSADDPFGGNAGLLQGGLGFAPGESGQAFNCDGTNDYVSVPAAAPLDVGAGDGLTLECWLKPADTSSGHAIAEWNNGAGAIGVHFWHSNPGIGGLGALFANLVSTNGASHLIASASNLMATNAFQHVALTFNRTNGAARIFRNGSQVATPEFRRAAATNGLWS